MPRGIKSIGGTHFDRIHPVKTNTAEHDAKAAAYAGSPLTSREKRVAAIRARDAATTKSIAAQTTHGSLDKTRSPLRSDHPGHAAVEAAHATVGGHAGQTGQGHWQVEQGHTADKRQVDLSKHDHEALAGKLGPLARKAAEDRARAIPGEHDKAHAASGNPFTGAHKFQGESGGHANYARETGGSGGDKYNRDDNGRFSSN